MMTHICVKRQITYSLKSVHFKKTVARFLLLSKLWYVLFVLICIESTTILKETRSRSCLLKMNGLQHFYFFGTPLDIYSYLWKYLNDNMQQGKAVCIMGCTKPTLTSLEARAFSTFPVKMQKCFDKIFVISIKKTFRLYFWIPSFTYDS